MTNKAVLYARQSTDIQQSISAQISALVDWNNQNLGAIVVADFKDQFSGKNTHRPGFQSMKTFIKERDIDVLLVWRYDRLARKLSDLVQFLEYCSNLNVKVISITEALSGEKNSFAMDQFQISMLGAWAEYQRKVIKENQQLGFQQKYNEGRIVSSQVPYGYRWIEGELLIDEAEAEIVRKIYRLYYQGTGYSKIAEQLNKKGLLNRHNKKWVVARIQAILKNDFYIGQVTSKYGNKNRHDVPIIPMNLFYEVQSLRKSKHIHKKWVVRRFILRKKLICPYCGSVCTPQHTLNNDKTYYYYRCARTSSDGTSHCKGVNLNAFDIETQVIQLVNDYIHSDVTVKKIKQQIENKNLSIKGKNQQKEKQIQKRQIKVLSRYEKGEITDKQLSESLKNIQKRKQKLKFDPLIPETIVSLLGTHLDVDNNPTVAHFVLYQEIIEKVLLNEKKEITAIYLVGIPYNILKKVDEKNV
ncbi:recombinase family protein [Marinilactibacillus psychrotolerans]|uniref:Site-specific recombinase, resolvase family, putative n=1 Tax=Marinilactibacillus psychrotolerans TaxID=191770 RepID=A0AAV3WUC5_9LACT|nr:recombinase family protein [Marinilactibacillus psychrotolerans]GEL66495.1 resolvase [Marinilactibacillus psychrotolerans]GEQ35311.1 site-specific recombinase, resolvase family, putative [Marinilactibacillus psychrotolerans]SDC52692.1 Site-specific DNA recombinase [Marinilactibacillus psychrotolerans]